MFVNTFWSLVPPIVAIGLALLTKETYSSLFIGIVVGALLATDFSPIGALDTIINDGLTAAIADGRNRNQRFDELEQWKQDMKGRIHHGTQNDSEQA